MHPAFMESVAAERVKDMQSEAVAAQRARVARRAPPPPLRSRQHDGQARHAAHSWCRWSHSSAWRHGQACRVEAAQGSRALSWASVVSGSLELPDTAV